MRTGTKCRVLWSGLCLLLPGPAFAAAEAQVEMEIAAEPGLPVNTHQEWYRLLVELKVSNLRIHSDRAAGVPAITTQCTAESPVYRVQGRLTSRGELLLPGGRFTLGDSARLGAWLANLKTNGPAGPGGASKALASGRRSRSGRSGRY